MAADVTGKAMKGAMNAVMADGVLHSVMKHQENISSVALMMDLSDVLTGLWTKCERK